MVAEVGGEQSGTLLHSLVEHTVYTLCVSAVNHKGEGPMSEIVMVKTVQGGDDFSFILVGYSVLFNMRI